MENPEEQKQQLQPIVEAINQEFSEDEPFITNYNVSLTEAYTKMEQQSTTNASTDVPMDELSFSSESIHSETCIWPKNQIKKKEKCQLFNFPTLI